MLRLYRYKKHGFPMVTAALVLCCGIVTIPTAFDRNLWYVFAMRGRPYFFWQWFSGMFEHSIQTGWFLWVHFLGNMSMALVFGVLIERVIGSRRMLQLTLWAMLSHALFFHLWLPGINKTGSGASGIVYVYAPVALYIMIRYFKTARPGRRVDPALGLLIAEFLLAWVAVTALAPWEETTVFHVAATLAGLIYLYFTHQTINMEVDGALHGGEGAFPSRKRARLNMVWLAPVFLSAIVALYFFGALNTMFVSPAFISPHATIAEVKAGGNEIEIDFLEPVNGFGSVYTQGADRAEVQCSEDGRTVYIRYPNGLTGQSRVELRNGQSQDGRIVREIAISVME